MNPLLRRLLHAYFWATRSMTLGIRGLVVDADGRVLLVRHTYVAGWHLPGGGVERDELAADSLVRELREEGAVEVQAPPELVGVYLNPAASRRDHVLLYRVREFRVLGERKPDREIAEAGWFARDALPEGTTSATRARLAEVLDGAPRSPIW